MGVVASDGRYRLIDSGPLPEAVAASAAIPFIFEPLDIPGSASCDVLLRCTGAVNSTEAAFCPD